MDSIVEYFLRITPGIALVIVTFLLLPKKALLLKICLLVMGFILMRDAMTPLGYWQFGISDTAPWIRFINDGWLLLTLGSLSLITAGVLLTIRDLRALIRWGNTTSLVPYIVGIGGGALVAAPFLALSLLSTATLPEVSRTVLPALLFMALAGNFLEELIFRGFLQSSLEKLTTSLRAALISGLSFGVAHMYLASTVTNLGWPVLLFVTFEGLVCAFIYRKYGLIAASLAHGTAIFLLACGLFS